MKTRTTNFALTLLLLLSLLPCAAAQMIVLTPEKAADAKKYTKLRLNYAKSKNYNPYDREYRKAEEKAWRMFKDEKKQQEALDEIEPFLKKNPYCISLLQTKAAMLREMGRTSEADKARQAWFGVLNSIMASGDGMSYQTAIHVIDVTEEYDVLGVREWERLKQVLVTHNGCRYDVLTVKDMNKPEAEPFDVFFNVDIPFRSIRKNRK